MIFLTWKNVLIIDKRLIFVSWSCVKNIDSDHTYEQVMTSLNQFGYFRLHQFRQCYTNSNRQV